jgi:hypothetical protein
MEASTRQHTVEPERVAELQAQVSSKRVLAGCCLVTPRGALASILPRSASCAALHRLLTYTIELCMHAAANGPCWTLHGRCSGPQSPEAPVPHNSW